MPEQQKGISLAPVDEESIGLEAPEGECTAVWLKEYRVMLPGETENTMLEEYSCKSLNCPICGPRRLKEWLAHLERKFQEHESIWVTYLPDDFEDTMNSFQTGLREKQADRVMLMTVNGPVCFSTQESYKKYEGTQHTREEARELLEMYIGDVRKPRRNPKDTGKRKKYREQPIRASHTWKLHGRKQPGTGASSGTKKEEWQKFFPEGTSREEVAKGRYKETLLDELVTECRNKGLKVTSVGDETGKKAIIEATHSQTSKAVGKVVGKYS